MSLYAGVLAAQREKECAAELGEPAVRQCKSPLCTRPLRKNNRSGWCYKCKQCRWAAREARLRRKAAGRCVHHCSQMAAPGHAQCVGHLEACRTDYRAAGSRRRQQKVKARVAYVARMVRLGRCPQCGNEKPSAGYLCAKCRRRAVQWDREYRARKALRADRVRVRELLAAVAA